jgi:hypothetical protein
MNIKEIEISWIEYWFWHKGIFSKVKYFLSLWIKWNIDSFIDYFFPLNTQEIWSIQSNNEHLERIKNLAEKFKVLLENNPNYNIDLDWIYSTQEYIPLQRRIREICCILMSDWVSREDLENLPNYYT